VKEIARIKNVAVELLATLKTEKLRVDQWREKESTRDAVRAAIFDFLYSDDTGLPAVYTDQEVKALSEGVFQYMFYAYPTVPSPLFAPRKSAN
jgi:type I restriction enzyme, R subunit